MIFIESTFDIFVLFWNEYNYANFLSLCKDVDDKWDWSVDFYVIAQEFSHWEGC